MKYTQSAVVSLFLALSSASAFAAEMNAGTIHFTGQIIEPSCTIVGDDGTDSTIPLGTYPKSYFSAPGTETELKNFSITLADCPLKSDGLPAVQLTFNGQTALTGSPTLLDVSKITTEGETAAKGVGIAVSPVADATKLIAFDGSEEQVSITLPTIKDDQIHADFSARYKSFDANVEAGPADADLTVNILYR
ncbi:MULTISPECIES: fimbrial protein [Enterobacter]|uniref:fimbrial protein n=1 Tax=Enterobacter TaxID=547 RepID=UPI0007C83E45|nr:fimbrial protein [Enterobacter cloacae complex sp. I2]MBE3513843.1 type 1 fimbrial protein [Enterobacter cloacae complex sp. I2]OAE38043.1 fimbrial protein [Enterobacter cloacae]OAE66350.1 fimbrial protein [Enterobacter cloacae]OAZ44392.1 fimbrial protein [Enterobacter cloacae]